MEAELGLLPFASGLLPLGMEAEPALLPFASNLLPFASGLLPLGMEAELGLLPFASTEMEATALVCFHFSRAARLKIVDTGAPNRTATARSGSPVAS